MSIPSQKSRWEFPHLADAHFMQEGDDGHDFWSLKFYPYTEPGLSQIFAVVGGRRILICRVIPPKDSKTSSTIDVLRTIIDEEKDVGHFACAWSKDVTTGSPLLCVAGNPWKIKIFDPLTGLWLRTLVGHGASINDLQVCPTDPSIIASASEDHTVRIWTLDPAYAKQPCAAILEGYGHTERLQTIAFHSNGRYLLSAGNDLMINLWTLPVFSETNLGKKKPIQIFCPHFSTSDIHQEIIDCVMWHGDLIFSKAEREGSIIMWTIDGFDSSLPPPEPEQAPAIPFPLRDTRSAFTSLHTNMGYTSLLKLKIPDSDIMFARFSIFHGSKTENPVVAFSNTNSKLLMWDLSRFREYERALNTMPNSAGYILQSAKSEAGTPIPPSHLTMPSNESLRGHPFLQPFQHRNRGGRGTALPKVSRDSPALSVDSHDTLDLGGIGKVNWSQSKVNWEKRYGMDPLVPVDAHSEVVIQNMDTLGRQVAWSNDGRYCVVASSWAIFMLFERWDKDVK